MSALTAGHDSDKSKDTHAQAGSIVLLLLGYGSFLSAYCGGPLVGALLARTFNGWEINLFTQFTAFAGLAIGCLVLQAARHRRGFRVRPSTAALLYAGANMLLLLTALSPLVQTALMALALFVFGMLSSGEFVLLLDRLLALYRISGRNACISLLAIAEFVPLIVGVLLSVLHPVMEIVSLFILATAGTSAACLVALFRDAEGSLVDDQQADPGISQTGAYRLSTHSSSMLACFGIMWGLACSISVNLTYGEIGDILLGPMVLTTAFAAIVIIAIAAVHLKGQRYAFGGFIRLVIVIGGIALTLAPVLHRIAPAFLYPACETVFVLLEICVVLFSLDICHETRQDIIAVMPINNALFTATACAAAILFWLAQAFLDSVMAWELIAVLATAAAVSIIPFLPSRNSDAIVLTLDKLPENEGYDEHVERTRKNLSTKYGLTDRESEVLELLLGGMTRNEVAAKLQLSPWTVKDRVGSIYEKLGIHSYKELTKLAAGEEEVLHAKPK